MPGLLPPNVLTVHKAAVKRPVPVPLLWAVSVVVELMVVVMLMVEMVAQV